MKAFYYERPDPNSDKVIILTRDREIISTTNIKKLDEQGKIGLVCFYISKGDSLKRICTGENWKPTLGNFLETLNKYSIYREMFNNAKNIRIQILEEELLELKNQEDSEKKINQLKAIISFLRPEAKQKAPIFKLVSWTGEEEDFNADPRQKSGDAESASS